VAGRYWPTASVVMKALPGMEARLGIRLRFEESLGTFTSCDIGAGSGLQYRVAVIIGAPQPGTACPQSRTPTAWGRPP
jgi:hypothetical protein